MKNKIMVGLTVTLLVLGLFQITLNMSPAFVNAESQSYKEIWKIVNVTNSMPYNTIVDVNATLNSRKGVNIACSPNVTSYFENPAGYSSWWDWLNGTVSLPYHWGDMDWFVTNGSLTSITYDEIQHWGNMYMDSGGGVNYTTFMGNTYMADWNLTSRYNDPDIIFQAFWQGNVVKMIDDLVVPNMTRISIVFKIVITEPGSYTFNITATPGVTVDPSSWTVGGASTLLVPQDYTTIQAAVNAASPGDTIVVAAGTYNENQIRISKALKIYGSGADSTIINGGDAVLSEAGLVRITANGGNVVFSGFTVRNAGGPFKGALKIRVGIYVESNATGPSYTISNNKIYGTNNTNEAEDYGFYAQSGKENIVFRNNLVTQTGANNIVLELHTGSTEISYNTLDAGVYGLSDSIFFMTYGGVNVTTLQNVSYNIFDMGTGVGPFDYNHRATGVSFCSVYPVLGSGPEAKFTNMVISGNTFNNLKSHRRGIGFWNAGSGDNLVSPLITGNTIEGVAGSTGSYGIDFYGLTTNATITRNTIRNTATAIALRSGSAPGTQINYNNIANNTIGIDWTLGTTAVDAHFNWWGNETGPTHATNPDGNGDTATDNVLFEPWLIKPYPPLAPISIVYVNPRFTVVETPALGTVFTVNITVANVTLMYGFQFTLKWNSTLLTLTNPAAAGKIPTVWGANYISQYNYSIPAGNYSFFASARSPAPPFNGTITLASLTFRSIYDPIYPQNVTCSLSLVSVTLADPDAKPILRCVYSGNYSCYSAKPKLLFMSKEYTAKKVPTEFDAQINVTNIVNLNAFNFSFTYDAGLLEIIYPYVTVPSFSGSLIVYKGWGDGTVFVNVTGIAPPLNGSIVLATVKFKVKTGFVWNTQTRVINSTLNFTIHEFNDGTVEHETINGTYRYKPVPGDLDLDGVVTIIDLAFAARAFGTNEGEPGWQDIADLNRDRTINILDLVIIARNFGREEPEP